ncbi:flippase [Geothrix alkalitolerans]|uniref:flippase n=1 Tax=Geothrix alkalitolerans TaxID=2922724 RepID=UPI001FAE83EE|nr:flippase [Geothrix alkalitolerans]
MDRGRALIAGRTARNTLLVTGGNLAGQAIGFVANLWLMRRLGPESYGRFGVAVAMMMLASQLSDIGITTGFVRYMALYHRDAPAKASRLLRLTFLLKLGVGAAVLAGGWTLSGVMAGRFLHAPELAPLLRIAFVGSLGATLFGFFQAVFQAGERFGPYVRSNVSNNVLKVGLVIGAGWGGWLQPLSAIGIFALVPFLGAVGALASLRKEERRDIFTGPWDSELAHVLIGFSKWITFSTVCVLVFNNIDTFLLQRLSSAREVGLYTSAWQLASIFPVVTGALTTAITPKVSGYRTAEEMDRHMQKVKSVTGVAIVGFLVLSGLSNLIIKILLGQQYIAAISIFNILLLSFMISLIMAPVSVLFFTMDKPQVLSWLNLIQLLMVVVLDLALIPKFGGIGAAISALIIRFFAIPYMFILLKKYRREWAHG